MTNSVRQAAKAAQDLDDRRKLQIANQIAIINRILKNPDAAAEIATLSEDLALAQHKLKRIEGLMDKALHTLLSPAAVQLGLDVREVLANG